MEFRHLKLIDTVATEGTLSKAAEKLHLTQSALSHQLKELERELGIAMFHRINRRLEISEAGNVIRHASIQVEKELGQALNQINEIKNGNKGEIRLSTECYTCYHWLPNVLKEFDGNGSHIEIKVLPAFTKRHFEGLLADELDLVITSLKTSDERVAYEDLFQDELLLITSTEHPLSSLPFVEPEHFEYETLLIYNKPPDDSTFYRHILKPAGIEPQTMEIRLTESAIELVRNNMGVKVMAKWAAVPYLKQGGLAAVKIGPHGYFRKWYLAYKGAAGWKKHYEGFSKTLKRQLKKVL